MEQASGMSGRKRGEPKTEGEGWREVARELAGVLEWQVEDGEGVSRSWKAKDGEQVKTKNY